MESMKYEAVDIKHGGAAIRFDLYNGKCRIDREIMLRGNLDSSGGRPLISLDHCGFSHVVNDTCGIKIPVTNPKEAINDFTIAIEKLYNDEALRYQLAEGALKRSKDFSWDKKIIHLNNIYKSLVE